jgi:hypothetical protein
LRSLFPSTSDYGTQEKFILYWALSINRGRALPT